MMRDRRTKAGLEWILRSVATGLPVAVSLGMMGEVSGQVWDAAADFSPVNNPAGAWSYGRSATRLSPFLLNTTAGSVGTAVYWGAGGTPGIWKNIGPNPAPLSDNPVLPPGVMMGHPGPSGENAVLRWTSPVSGSVFVTARFGGVMIDPNGDSVDVAVVRNGVQLFGQFLDGIGTHADYESGVSVGVGDTLDFHIGFGSNGTYVNDSTALAVVVDACARFSQSPAPASACVGDTRAFTAVATGAAPLTFRWEVRGLEGGAWSPLVDGTVIGVGVVSGAGTAELRVTGVYGEGRSLRCVAANGCGEKTGAAAELFVDPADLGVAGGLPGRDGMHDNNDFIAFISYFFSLDYHADLGRAGGELGADGLYDNNDFISFISLFFADC